MGLKIREIPVSKTPPDRDEPILRGARRVSSVSQTVVLGTRQIGAEARDDFGQADVESGRTCRQS